MEILQPFVENFNISLLISLVFFVYGFISFIRLLIISNRKIDVNLEVIDILAKTIKRDRKRETFYYPKFRIISGPYKSLTYESRTGTYPRPHEIGERTKGLYDPKRNTIISVKIHKMNYLFSVLFTVFGVALFWFFFL